MHVFKSSFLFISAVSALLAAAFAASGSSHHKSPSQALSVISDEDQASVTQIKHHMTKDFSDLKSVDEVLSFLDKVKLLIQKHPKNVAFAQNDLKELHKFLSQDSIVKLARVDTEPFIAPISEDKIAVAQRAIEADELTGKLFSAPIRSLIDSRRQSANHNGSHDKDSSFFSNFWCKLSGNCDQ